MNRSGKQEKKTNLNENIKFIHFDKREWNYYMSGKTWKPGKYENSQGKSFMQEKNVKLLLLLYKEKKKIGNPMQRELIFQKVISVVLSYFSYKVLQQNPIFVLFCAFFHVFWMHKFVMSLINFLLKLENSSLL